LDLAVPNLFDDDVSILLGNGDGTFVTPATDFQVGDAPVFVAVGLFDADSNLDLAVVNQFGADVSILLGNGDGTFVTPATDFQVGEEPVSVAVGNFN
ncbi:MAG: VCBS repeat-containing protein, partial [Nitrososphaeraceae archaeon]